VQLPLDDKNSSTKEYLLSRIAILMGGRIAEEMFFGANQVTTGASNDIERASELARAMVCEYGMSELGPLTFGKKEEQIFLGREISQHRDYSENTAILIDQAVRKMVSEQYDVAVKVIKDNKDAMIRLAEALIQFETLDAVQIKRAVAGLPVEEAGSSSDDNDPQKPETVVNPFKPILPPITGNNPATA
jgi:cell division protease FtsH